MALYLIGDVQGCNNALGRLLDDISFSPSRDTLFMLGDMVNRGPDSTGVLRRLMGFAGSVQCVLGNHDLHLLALAHGVRQPHRTDTLNSVLTAPDRQAMLDWLRWQRMAIQQTIAGHELLLVHAGVLPGWSASKTIALAGEMETVLRGPDLGDFLQRMYGNEPSAWSEALVGIERLRVIVNALTRIRFCDDDGHMEFLSKEDSTAAPEGFRPWFDVPGRQTANICVAFGHWSMLGPQKRSDIISLDTGCVWGGKLSSVRLVPNQAPGPLSQTLIQVDCEQALKPGLPG